MRPVVVIPTVYATLRLCRVGDGGMPTCEAAVPDRDGAGDVQCGADAPWTRRDPDDLEHWPACEAHRGLPPLEGALL